MTLPVTPENTPRTLQEAALHLLAFHGDDVAVVWVGADGTRTYGYQTFFEMAQLAGGAMESAGVGPGDVVPIMMRSGVEKLAAWWGAVLLGAVPVNSLLIADADLKNLKNSPILETMRSRPSQHIYVDQFHVQFAQAMLPEAAHVAAEAKSAPLTTWHPANTAQTACVTWHLEVLSHAAILKHVAVYSRHIRLSAEDVIFVEISTIKDAGLYVGLLAFLQGVKLVLVEGSWQKALASFARHRVSLAFCSNVLLGGSRVKKSNFTKANVDLSGLRLLVEVITEPGSTEIREFQREYAATGLSEQALSVCYHNPQHVFAVTQSSPHLPLPDDEAFRGAPLDGVEIRILDDNGDQLPEGERGWLWVRSPFACDGYLNTPAKTAHVIRPDGWIFTGNLGYLYDGYLYI